MQGLHQKVHLTELFIIILVLSPQLESLQINPKSYNSFDRTEIYDNNEDIKTSSLDTLNRQNVWTVVDPDQHHTCILLQGSLELKVPYLQQTELQTIKVPHDAIAEGSCSTLWGDYQEIKLTWNLSTSINNTVLTNSVYLGFVSGWDSEVSDLSIPYDQYALNSITVVYHGSSPNESTNSTLMSYSVSDFIAFLTPRNRAFSCSAENTLSIGELEFKTSDLRFQAFTPNEYYAGFFNEEVECSLDQNTELWDGIFEFIKWFSVASTIVIAVVAILYVLLKYVQKRLDSWNIEYKVLWNSWSN